MKNAPAHFQRTIDRILGSFRFDFALAFIDDIVVFSKSFDDHLSHVELVLDALLEAGMIMDEAKCHFCYKSIELLGHRVSRFGLSTQAEKVAAINALPFPRTHRSSDGNPWYVQLSTASSSNVTLKSHFLSRKAWLGPKKKVFIGIRNSPRRANCFLLASNLTSEPCRIDKATNIDDSSTPTNRPRLRKLRSTPRKPLDVDSRYLSLTILRHEPPLPR